MIACYVEELMDGYSRASVKQHLAAIRMMFDYFVTGGLLRHNPALSVKGPRLSIVQGKTPVLMPTDARHLLDSIETDKIGGLRDRALISLMLFTFARIGAAVAMNVDNVYQNGRGYWVRLHEKWRWQSEIEVKMVVFFESLGERDRRRYAAVEATKLGHGGVTYISQLFGCDSKTIERGKSEIENPLTQEDLKRQRKKTAAARKQKLLRLKSSKASASS